MKIHVKTLGLRLNQAEAERIAQGFVLTGHVVTEDEREADLIVLNSCTVTGEAGRKSVQAARHHAGQRVVVTGCHSEVRPHAFGDEAIIVANAEKENLLPLIGEALGTEGFALGADYRADGDLQLYPLVLDQTRAFVKIQDGCNLACSFCLTTIARGDARSRDADAIVAEVQRLAARGCQEVVLTGVHAGSYGRESAGELDLGGLITRILHESELPRLRLSSLEPWHFKPSWLELWPRWGERLCAHLHMSLQSGSDAILRRMKRAYRTEEFAAMVDAARAMIPDVALTTDIIVGFPAETEEEHRESMAFVKAMAFADAHIFTFSPRPGTRAATMGGQLPNRLKKARWHEMAELSTASAEAFRRAMIGSQQRVLWEQRRNDGTISGLTGNYLRVTSDDPAIQRNQLSTVTLEVLEGDGFRVAGRRFGGH